MVGKHYIKGTRKGICSVPLEQISQNTLIRVQHDCLCLRVSFLYAETESKEQEVSGQLVLLCPNGSSDVIIFLKEATAALCSITTRLLSVMSDCYMQS